MRTFIAVLALAVPVAVQATTISFVGSVSNIGIYPGASIPENYVGPSSFSGIVEYDPTASTYRSLLTSIFLDFGDFTITRNATTLYAGSTQISDTGLTYSDSFYPGLDYPALPGLGINGFTIKFDLLNGPGQLGAFDFAGLTGGYVSFNIGNRGSITVQGPIGVPEPGTLTLFGAGLLALGAARRRRSLHESNVG